MNNQFYSTFFLEMWLLTHAGIKINSYQKKGAQEVHLPDGVSIYSPLMQVLFLIQQI